MIGNNVFNQSANALTQAVNRTGQLANGNLGFGVGKINPALSGGAGNIQAANGGQAGQIAGMNLSAYMNPYTQNVINNTMNTLGQQRNQMLNQVGADATAAGAFGGSRHGLVEAETNRGFGETMANTAAGLNQANFQNAQQMGLADIQNQMNMGQFNAGLQQQTNMQNAANRLNNNQFNAGQQQQANMQNAANQMQQGQFGANMQLQAANQLGNLSNLGFGMGQSIQGMQNQAGGQQQAINQAIIDAGRGQYNAWQNQPQSSLQNLIAALGSSPNQSTTTTSNNPGLLGILSGGASMLGALGLCWISRAAFGADNPEWLTVRKWMLTRAPEWLFKAYVKHGPDAAAWIERNPAVKPFVRGVLRQMVRA